MSLPTDNGYGEPVVPLFLNGKIPVVNVDKIDRLAGLEMLEQLGYDGTEDLNTFMIIDYCLWRHGHGEEVQAEKQAIDKSNYGVSFTEWRMCLAAAIAGAQT